MVRGTVLSAAIPQRVMRYFVYHLVPDKLLHNNNYNKHTGNIILPFESYVQNSLIYFHWRSANYTVYTRV